MAVGNMNSTGRRKRILFFGAHPDDADLVCGGTAARLSAAGHEVHFVSMVNGDCGHFSMTPEALAERRYQETQNSARIGGVRSYEVWDIHDCELQVTLENRRRVIRTIREFSPDVVISHRTCDYHADHRAAGQLVMDAAYLVKVPMFCPDSPIPAENPVFAVCYDVFTDPRKVRLDAVVPLDDVIETKISMLCCHESQFFEWLPWDEGQKDFDVNRIDRRALIRDRWLKDNRDIAAAAGISDTYAEAFEQSPYGRQVSAEDFQKLFEP